jgi:hypothetical protein
MIHEIFLGDGLLDRLGAGQGAMHEMTEVLWS